jgi:glycine/D-amino acid oxidase-like deaminating enzyme/nitrite reductase/ring-hydroxylating ferredoxin subunit
VTTELGKHESLWLDTTPDAGYPPLRGDRQFDVLVIGAGITGLTTALLCAREGLSVAVVDQHRVGAGVTGHTTAKVTSQHGLTYARLLAAHGPGGARTYAEANEAAKERIAALVAEGIDCDFRRRTAYVYASTARQRPLVQAEAKAAEKAGLPATFVDDVPLPFETHGALRFDNQAEFHARRYVLGLARLLHEAGGEIFEETRVHQVHDGEPCRADTEGGEVTADHVVVATLMPFLDRGLFFARAFASRSYVLTARIADAPPEGMFINASSPIRSIRTQPHDGGELLMVGGEGHHVGSGKAQPERWEKLAEFARSHWQVEAFEHRWSSQDYSSDDGVPYVGRVHLRSRHIHIATGFKKWGMTNGTVAAELICDAIAGRDNPWSGLFSSTRIKPLAENPRFAVENARVGMHFFADRITDRGSRPIDDLQPGEGAIVSADGQKVAGYRDEGGALHAVSSRCTHLYCQVHWNAAEHTWDCPCHGSRFSVDGEVLNGPAVDPLPQRPTGSGNGGRAAPAASVRQTGAR